MVRWGWHQLPPPPPVSLQEQKIKNKKKKQVEFKFLKSNCQWALFFLLFLVSIISILHPAPCQCQPMNNYIYICGIYDMIRMAQRPSWIEFSVWDNGHQGTSSTSGSTSGSIATVLASSNLRPLRLPFLLLL